VLLRLPSDLISNSVVVVNRPLAPVTVSGNPQLFNQTLNGVEVQARVVVWRDPSDDGALEVAIGEALDAGGRSAGQG